MCHCMCPHRAAPEIMSMLKQNSCRNVLGMTKDAQNVLRGNRICYKFHMIQQLMNLEAINTYKNTAGRGTGGSLGDPGGFWGTG